MINHKLPRTTQPKLLVSIFTMIAMMTLVSGLVVPDVAQAQESPVISLDDLSLSSTLKWKSIGPNRGGRSIAAAGSPDRPFEYYFGATGGGLWKTTDGGTNWFPVTDGQIKSSSVGAVAVSESNPDIVYLGMGEAQLRGNVMQGDGVYRSTNAGKSWEHLGLEETQVKEGKGGS